MKNNFIGKCLLIGVIITIGMLCTNRADAKVIKIKSNNISEYAKDRCIAIYDVKNNSTTIYDNEEIEKIVKKEKASRFRIGFKEPKHKLETIVGSNINRRTFQYSGNGVLPTIIGNDDRMLVDNIYRNEFPICATAAISVRHQNGSYSGGTAFNVGPRLTATAGHILIDRSGSFPDDTMVEFGLINGTANYTYHERDIQSYIWVGGATGEFNSDNDYGFIVWNNDISEYVGHYGVEYNYNIGDACATYGYPVDSMFNDSMIFELGTITSKYNRTLELNLDSNEGQSGSPIYVNGGYAIGILRGGNGYSTFARQLDSDLTDWLDAHGYFD